MPDTGEHAFVKAVLNAVRKDESGVNLTKIMRSIARENDLGHASGLEKSQAWNKLGAKILEHRQGMNSNTTGTQATMNEFLQQIKQLTEENAKLRSGDTGASASASSNSAASGSTGGEQKTQEAFTPINEIIAKFEKGDKEPMLEGLGLKSLNQKAVSAKIEGFRLNSTKTEQLTKLVNELTSKLHEKTPKPERVHLETKLARLAVTWGLDIQVVSAANTITDYKMMARLIAAAHVLAQ